MKSLFFLFFSKSDSLLNGAHKFQDLVSTRPDIFPKEFTTSNKPRMLTGSANTESISQYGEILSLLERDRDVASIVTSSKMNA